MIVTKGFGGFVMATVKEVAKEAGVSVGTVSNVLNGKTGDRGSGRELYRTFVLLSSGGTGGKPRQAWLWLVCQNHR